MLGCTYEINRTPFGQQGPPGSSFYTEDGTLTGDREIDGGGFSMRMTNWKTLEWNTETDATHNVRTFATVSAGSALWFTTGVQDSTDARWTIEGRVSVNSPRINLNCTNDDGLSEVLMLADGITVTTPSLTLLQDLSYKFGIWGATPIVRPAHADQAVAVVGDADSAVRLANALRTALINLGWIKGAA